VTLFAAEWYSHLLNAIVLVLGLALMLLILIQRGKGGGLAGAFGGAGGSSPFGSRSADQFVRVTLWLAGVWVLVIMIHVKVVKFEIGDRANKPVTTSYLERERGQKPDDRVQNTENRA
jgi:preprotein translocase subunit SecG